MIAVYIVGTSQSIYERDASPDKMVVRPRESPSKALKPILFIDPDPEYQHQIRALSQRVLVPVCFAKSLDQAEEQVGEAPLLGVVLSLSALKADQDLAWAISKARRLSAAKTLPVALVYEDSEVLEEVHALWAGASTLVLKPIYQADFDRLVQRLDALRRARQPRLLVIEDDRCFITWLKHSLRGLSIRVDHHNLSEPLLDILEEHRPHVLLLDAHLQKAPAFDLCRRLRSLPRWQDLPIIFFAHSDHDALRLRAYQAGADDFLTPELSSSELNARIQVRLLRTHLSRERSDRDELTGLLTRRAFIEQFHARLSGAKRHNRRLALCLIDIDRFKEVNDLHGHLAGDQVLRRLGVLLRERFRAEDLRGRWGGEEFMIALVDEDAPTAQLVLKRVLDEFASLRFESSYSGRIFQVTFSAGVAEYPLDAHDLESLISVADRRLFKAKAGGRRAIFVDRPLI